MPGPFKEKWTPKQRGALIEAMFDRAPKLTQAQAMRAANDGSLKEGLAPFPVPYNTVVDIRRKEDEKRRRERAQGTPLSHYASDVRRLLARQLEDEKAKGKRADDRKLTRLLQGIQQAEQLCVVKPSKMSENGHASVSRLASALREDGSVGGVGAGQSSASALGSEQLEPAA